MFFCKKVFPRFVFPALIAGVLYLSTPRSAAADGIVIPEPPPGDDPIPLQESWLTIEYHRVDVQIEDQIAVTRIQQEFTNQHSWEAEATYLFPVPEGAVITDFNIWMEGELVSSQLLSAEQAREIYQDTVRQRKDPALLEYLGQGAVQARLFPIPPGASRRIDLEYTQILPVDQGLIHYSYPLNTEKFSARPLKSCSVRVEIKSSDPLRTIYSPTHQDRVFVNREGDYRAVISYEDQDVLPVQDFELMFTLSSQEVGIQFLTSPADKDGEGYFLLLAAPGVEQTIIVPRDVVLVLDTSGSMEGEKLHQAKQALRFVLQNLNPADRFNVAAFSSGVRFFREDLQPVSQTTPALSWIEDLPALGGTNIQMALQQTLQSRESENQHRPLIILFLTDGLPTEGETDVEEILSQFHQEADSTVRLFSFGVGDDVNTTLLDALAVENRGTSGYVRPGESITDEVSSLFRKIQRPVLTDVELVFGGVQVEDLYPRQVPDLFAGSQLIMTGRYRSAEPGTMAVMGLSGVVNGERRIFRYPIQFREGEQIPGQHAAIPRLWAARKIGYYLTRIRLEGEQEEWIQAVIDLSIRYGIMTPYTSFLIADQDLLTSSGRESIAEDWLNAPRQPTAGEKAVDQADAESDLRAAESVAPPLRNADGQLEPSVIFQAVGEKTFLWNDGVWIDTEYDPDVQQARVITFDSRAYYQLLDQQPEWGDYFALGKEVTFVIYGKVYQIGLE